jgi:hypothetical protein
VLLKEVSKTEGATKKRKDLSSRSPPFITVGNRRPVPSRYPHSQSDWEKPHEQRDYTAFESTAKNKTTKELQPQHRPMTEADERIGSDATHARNLLENKTDCA